MHMGAFALSWGWNPVVFFIVLAVSLLVAVRLKKSLVIWVLPALVLYFGLDWALPWSWLFKTIFWVTTLAAVFTAAMPGTTKFAKLPLKVVSLLVGVLLVLTGISAAGNWLDGSGHHSTTPPTVSSMPTSTSGPGSNGTATVTESNGTKEIVPLVNSANGGPSANTTQDSLTPSSLPVGLCPILVNWKTLVDCVETHHLQWYINGVNQRSSQTGFNWSNIEQWANAANAGTVEVRAIEVYGSGVSDAEARNRAEALVGSAATTMNIVHQPECFDNTRGLKAGEMQDFVYCPPGSRQVRVSLLPVNMKDGVIVAIRNTQSGVFVDCDNVWWVPEIIIQNHCVVNCTPGPCTSHCTPGCSVSCTPKPGCTVNCKPSCPWPLTNGKCLQTKDPNQDPARQGNVPTQVTGSNPPVTSGPSAPAVSQPKGVYTPPSTPTPTPTPRATQAPAPETGAPSPSDPQTTCIVAPGTSSC